MELIYSETAKKRLDSYLTEQLKDLSRSQVQRAIKQGRVTLNQAPTSVHHWLKSGDVINYDATPAENVSDKILGPEPEVILESEDFLVIDKPAGLLVHPTERHEQNTLISWLLLHYPQLKTFGDPTRPGLVHRLDRDVSGLIVVALTPEAYQHLKQQFQDRTIDKRYTALVHGVIAPDDGIIDTRLARDKKTGLTKAQSALQTMDEAKEAITHYRVLQRFVNYTLLEIKLITGRTHQIRAHLQSIGHSLVGDPLYYTRDIKKKKPTSLTRPFLHASSITFNDLQGQPVHCESSLPDLLQSFISSLT